MSHDAGFNMLNLVNIEKLNGNNFNTWKQQIEMNLGILEFNIAFKTPKPTTLVVGSTAQEREHFAKWEIANQMSFLIMQNAMKEHIRDGISSCDLAKDYMARTEEKFKWYDKAKVGASLSAFINSKHDGSSSVREHLLKMVNISNKLNAMDIGITDQFLVHIALYFLSGEYDQIKVNYNTQKETWSINELIAICCQEEKRLKKSKADRVELANLVNTSKGKGKMIVGNKNDNCKGNKPSGSLTTPNAAIGPKKQFKGSGDISPRTEC
ncbi:disease resistance protein [Pyrus ussuriensis x Pyrus communis]|uniref:Disease resistance protein n=1 Tax=Pyrus ussuriensis x Pyrus communis TaxID=2448454 RepID=A0A5N5FDE1_9ROSA|nr:disease resistance protein [Pyrus ussuriensis x Pyrus communis]